MRWRGAGRSLGGALLTGALSGTTIAVLARLYTSGRISLAATGAAIFALYQLQGQLRSLGFSASSLYEATLFVRDYDSFVALEPGADPRPEAPARFERLAVEGVTFRCPGAPRAALDGVSLDIRAGEVVALVGENGSGKTTLAKLLAGLYRPVDVGGLYADVFTLQAAAYAEPAVDSGA